jgi:hypothetical protein
MTGPINLPRRDADIWNMSLKFVVSHLDQQMGPFTEQELKTKWSKGELLPIDYVYDELKKDWILLAERFDWVAAPMESAPPPLKPTGDRKKAPPLPAMQSSAPQARANMSQQKPAESTIIVHNPVIEDPMPSPTSLPMTHTQHSPVVAAKTPTPRPQPAKVKIINGVGEIDLSPDTPGQVELVVQNSSNGNLKLQEPLKIQVRPLEPEEIVWTIPLQQTVGQDLEITFKAVDGRGTICTHFSENFTIRLAGSDPKTISVQIQAGVAAVKIANTKAEQWEVSIQYAGARALRWPETKTIEWQPGPAARLILDGPPDLIAGHPLKVQVKAVDQFGNLANTFQGTVVLEVKAS